MGYLSNYKKSRKENQAYRQILNRKLKTAKRQAYAEEAEKVAREKARARARGQIGFGASLRKVASAAVSKKAVRRAAPVKRRRKGSRKRTKTRTVYVTRKAKPKKQGVSLGDFF